MRKVTCCEATEGDRGPSSVPRFDVKQGASHRSDLALNPSAMLINSEIFADLCCQESVLFELLLSSQSPAKSDTFSSEVFCAAVLWRSGCMGISFAASRQWKGFRPDFMPRASPEHQNPESPWASHGCALMANHTRGIARRKPS